MGFEPEPEPSGKSVVDRKVGRRALLTALGVGGGAALLLPKWAKPVIDVVEVPLHAQFSGGGDTSPPELICVASASNPTVNLGVPLTFSVSAPQSGVTYTWSAPGGSPPSGTGTSFTTTFSRPGTYTITPSVPEGAGTPCSVNVVKVLPG